MGVAWYIVVLGGEAVSLSEVINRWQLVTFSILLEGTLFLLEVSG